MLGICYVFLKYLKNTESMDTVRQEIQSKLVCQEGGLFRAYRLVSKGLLSLRGNGSSLQHPGLPCKGFVRAGKRPDQCGDHSYLPQSEEGPALLHLYTSRYGRHHCPTSNVDFLGPQNEDEKLSQEASQPEFSEGQKEDISQCPSGQ